MTYLKKNYMKDRIVISIIKKKSNYNPVWKEFIVYMDYVWDYQNLPVQV